MLYVLPDILDSKDKVISYKDVFGIIKLLLASNENPLLFIPIVSKEKVCLTPSAIEGRFPESETRQKRGMSFFKLKSDEVAILLAA
jgi:hypothetical protein